MEAKSRLVLEHGSNNGTDALLEYSFPNGESITMRLRMPLLQKGEQSKTVQQIEEWMLRQTIDIAQSMLSASEGRGV